VLQRRDFILGLGAAALARRCGGPRATALDGGPVLEGAGGSWPGKSPDLVLHTDRPPNLEMPPVHLLDDLTPNEHMFVRWHLAGIPTTVDLRSFRLTVAGHVERPLSLSYDELQAMGSTTVVAVNQCSGNSRALFSPRVPGVQWGSGAVGNARWTGAPLGALLDRAGVRAGARCVTLRGLDRPPIDGPPPFVKSLDVDRARDPDVLVAWAMNGAPLPMLNGFPLRLVVPGWFATYWVKALTEITVLDRDFDGFWMAKAYRIPRAAGGDEAPDALAKDTVPITRMPVRSLFARPAAGERLAAGAPYVVEGVAFDGGSGIARVEVSTDGGASWRDAALGDDLGRHSFRRWRLPWTPSAPGPASLVARATSASGEAQRPAPGWNRAGYLRNVYERVEVQVS
jgi:sulfite dehydrogenase